MLFVVVLLLAVVVLVFLVFTVGMFIAVVSIFLFSYLFLLMSSRVLLLFLLLLKCYSNVIVISPVPHFTEHDTGLFFCVCIGSHMAFTISAWRAGNTLVVVPASLLRWPSCECSFSSSHVLSSSVHIFLMFSLRRRDVLPVGDLGLRKGKECGRFHHAHWVIWFFKAILSFVFNLLVFLCFSKSHLSEMSFRDPIFSVGSSGNGNWSTMAIVLPQTGNSKNWYFTEVEQKSCHNSTFLITGFLCIDCVHVRISEAFWFEGVAISSSDGIPRYKMEPVSIHWHLVHVARIRKVVFIVLLCMFVCHRLWSDWFSGLLQSVGLCVCLLLAWNTFSLTQSHFMILSFVSFE